jgi:hypothetical protein
MIHNIAPTETPFQSMAKKGKATNKLVNWQKDSLRAAATNTQVEGDTPSNTTVTPTTNLFNVAQISSYAFNISGTQQAVNPAGRADELAYQLVKYGKELKRDMEKALTGPTPPAPRALRALPRPWNRGFPRTGRPWRLRRLPLCLRVSAPRAPWRRMTVRSKRPLPKPR